MCFLQKEWPKSAKYDRGSCSKKTLSRRGARGSPPYTLSQLISTERRVQRCTIDTRTYKCQSSATKLTIVPNFPCNLEEKWSDVLIHSYGFFLFSAKLDTLFHGIQPSNCSRPCKITSTETKLAKIIQADGSRAIGITFVENVKVRILWNVDVIEYTVNFRTFCGGLES